MVTKTITGDIWDILNKGSFSEFSITFDGTPAFAEAEAVIIRVVTKDYHILELLVKCNLFSKKLNDIELGSHIESTITNRYGKSLKDWVAAQQDRASTNKGPLRAIEEKVTDVKVCKNYCCSHSLSNGDKKWLMENNLVPNMQKISEKYFR